MSPVPAITPAPQGPAVADSAGFGVAFAVAFLAVGFADGAV
ncbi:hypothetical protein [Bradyrhizobium barranii]|nr:hypothetical protein [Bradyrhizobium japonicum]